jgi:hypothetical protein
VQLQEGRVESGLPAARAPLVTPSSTVKFRWRALDPGPEPDGGAASAVPAVAGLVIVPLVLFLLELPIVLIRALIGLIRGGRARGG